MAEAILELAADPDRRRRLGEMARQLAVEHLDREIIIARYEQRLSWLVSGRTAACASGRRHGAHGGPLHHDQGTRADAARMNRRTECANIRLRFEYWPVIWLWPLSLVLMQATLFEIGDFSVTVAVIACHLLQLHARRVPTGQEICRLRHAS